MAGYFQADRSLAQAYLPKHGTKFSELDAYIFLTSFAAYAPRDESVGSKLVSLNVGELIASERYLMERWSWSRTKVRNFKEILKKRGLLDQREDQRETILIVYFIRDGGGGPGSKKTTKDTKGEPPKDHGGTDIINNNEQGTMDKLLSDPPEPDVWELIWEQSPKISRTRSSRKKTKEAWGRIPVKSRPSRETVVNALNAWKSSEGWVKDNGRFIPGIHRWVNERQWENIPDPPSPQGTLTPSETESLGF